MTGQTNQIDLTGGEVLTDQSHEVARIWVTNGAGSSVWINASALEDPFVFGILMADTIRHAARAYRTTWSLEEASALQAIVDGLGDELRHQSAPIETIQPGSLN